MVGELHSKSIRREKFVEVFEVYVRMHLYYYSWVYSMNHENPQRPTTTVLMGLYSNNYDELNENHPDLFLAMHAVLVDVCEHVKREWVKEWIDSGCFLPCMLYWLISMNT